MNEDEAYLDIANRYLESCEEHISNNINIQEVIGFKSYHAFESIGGAFNSHFGHPVPKSHVGKLNTFIANARHNPHVNGRAIATVAILMHSVRNKYLYPESSGSSFIIPKQQISLTSAKDAVRRVKGIIRQIERLI